METVTVFDRAKHYIILRGGQVEGNISNVFLMV